MSKYKYAIIDQNEYDNVVVYFTDDDLENGSRLPAQLNPEYWVRMIGRVDIDPAAMQDYVNKCMQDSEHECTIRLIDLPQAIAEQEVLIQACPDKVVLVAFYRDESAPFTGNMLAYCVIPIGEDETKLDNQRWEVISLFITKFNESKTVDLADMKEISFEEALLWQKNPIPSKNH